MPDKRTGLFVTDAGRVLVAAHGGTLTFALSPAELRGLAADLLLAAEGVEDRAAAIAGAALAKAGARVQ